MADRVSDKKYNSLGRKEEEDAVGVHSPSLVAFDVYGPIILLIFLLGRACVFSAVEKWGWVASLYFCVVSLSTVGYGDETPNTNAMKIFTVFYIYVGIAFVASIVGQLVGRAVTRGHGSASDDQEEEAVEEVKHDPE